MYNGCSMDLCAKNGKQFRVLHVSSNIQFVTIIGAPINPISGHPASKNN